MFGGERYECSGTACRPRAVLYDLSGFWVVIALLFLSLSARAAAAKDLTAGFDAYLEGDYATAYALLSPAANNDNPSVQNLVGLLLYYGRGTTADPARAHSLFHEAAELGLSDARKNLGVLHTIGATDVPVDLAEARMWFTAAAGNFRPADSRDDMTSIPAAIEPVIQVEFEYDGQGKQTYLTFCSGCHGFTGMRFFPFSPSFAMGERMTKSNEELMQSILHGKGLMPSWKDKLSLSELENALGYLRELALRTGYGTDTSAYEATPEKYFIFGEQRRIGPSDLYWNIDPLDSP